MSGNEESVMSTKISLDDFGALSDGSADCSQAFQAALRELDKLGGGTLQVPRGTYTTGPLELKSNTHLYLSSGAVIRFIPDPSRYPPVETRWEGLVCNAMHPLIYARDSSNISLSGQGTIDGSGLWWWKTYREKRARNQRSPELAIELELANLNGSTELQPSGGGGREMQFLRPPLIQFYRCSKILMEGITFRNSPFWTIHPVFSDNIEIRGITIINPSDAPNTDGIDIDSCSDVTILHSTIDVGDDCLALKAGSGHQGLAENKPTRNVIIQGCTFLNGHGGVVIGSETAGGVENVEVLNCQFDGTDRGIRIKSRRGRGGIVQNLDFRNLLMRETLCPLTINLYYNCGASAEERPLLFSSFPEPLSSLTPRIRNVKISNLTALDCRSSAGFIAGLPESPIENLLIENFHASLSQEKLKKVSNSEMYEGLPEIESRGVRIRNASCIIHGLQVEGTQDHEKIIEEQGSRISGLGN